MGGGRRSRRIGDGMTPLFDISGYARPADDNPTQSPQRPARTSARAVSAAPSHVSYWIRGVFRFGSGEERTRTVEGHTMSDRRDADITQFAAYLSESGWLFPEGRGVMLELLG